MTSIRIHRPIALLMFVGLAIATVARAQSAVDGFDPGANGDVYDMAVQPDGKIVVVGAFTALGGGGTGTTTRNRIGRLNVDGSVDTSFNPGADGQVFALLVQPDGKIVVGGTFSALGGGTGTTTRRSLGRLNADGSLDPTFNPGTNFQVFVLAAQPDGKILVGGNFSSLGGGGSGTTTRNRIGRLNADGSLDTSFDPGANGDVIALAVQPDGKIVVGGAFAALGGGGFGTTTRNRIGRLNADGSLDTSFDPGADSVVRALALQPDRRILAGGNFSMLGGGPRSRIGRLNADGSLDAGFNPGAENSVGACAVQPDGKILVGGDFRMLGGGGAGATARERIGRLNADGSLDASFNPGADFQVRALAVQADRKILVGGAFFTLGGGGTGITPRNYIGRLNADGSLEANFDPGANGAVVTVAVQPDGKILVGGDFAGLGGATGTTTRNQIGRLNADGSLDTSFNPGANLDVFAVAVQPDGKILVGGVFTGLGGGTGTTPRNFIGRFNADGSLDASFNPGANDAVLAVAMQPDGGILVAGDFTALGGGGTGTTPRNHIGRLNADGSLDASFNPGANNAVEALAVQADGKILVGGFFTRLGGGGTGTTPRNCIGRLNADGSLDSSFNPGANGGVYTVVVQPDGKILVAGDFTTLGGGATGTTPRNKIGRLNADGSLDASFDPGANGFIGTVAVQADGKIVVGGVFTTLGGGGTGTTTRNRIGRLDADGSIDTAFNPGANSQVFAVAAQPDGKIVVGGAFATLGGGGSGTTPRNFIGRLANADAAIQSLSVTVGGSAVTWSRGGAGPEVWRVTFESSADGTTYTSLGNGTRIVGGWRLSNQTLPVSQTVFIRARGYYATGFSNGSGSVVESIQYLNVSPPTLTLTPSTLNLAVVNNSGSIGFATPTQFLSLTQSGSGTVTWTVTANQPWITFSQSLGSAPAAIGVTINNTGGTLPASGTLTATVTVATTGGANNPTSTVNVTVFAPNQTTTPIGVFDTPTDGQTGVTGSIAVTGWTVDDIGVTQMQLYRDRVASEGAGGLIPIGNPVFVNGARPDVAALYPNRPLKDQAGWGYLLLTNFLPNQGNGTFRLHAYALDVEGNLTLLGSKTITCTNATATAPFGTIDTPAQGAPVSGAAYLNFGWALTPNPKVIPNDGSTIQVFIDSIPVGTVTYNNARSDIQALFPGYANTNGAVGFRTLDTTPLTNGVHTIAWVVTDNLGAASGIGSRYFTVANSSLVAGLMSAARPSTASGRADEAVRTGSVDARMSSSASSHRAIPVRYGYADDAVSVIATANADGVYHVRTAQLERIVFDLISTDDPDVTYRGYAIEGDEWRALPVGSHLDVKTGEFAWAPGLAFGGTHHLVFERDANGRHEQIRVDVAIDPQAPAHGEPRLVIDTPSAGATVDQPFTIAGWALDPNAPASGSGVDTLHVWAYPVSDTPQAPRWVGVAGYGGLRPDVAALLGWRFAASGFTIEVAHFPAGTYDLVVYAHSTVTGRFTIARAVRVAVR